MDIFSYTDIFQVAFTELLVSSIIICVLLLFLVLLCNSGRVYLHLSH